MTAGNGAPDARDNVELGEVFVLSGVPKYTFVKPDEYTKLLASLATPGRGLVLEGPSGVGKTTGLVRALTELGYRFTKLEARRPKDVELIRQLPEMGATEIVIVDDFHRLDADIKRLLADYMKLLAETDDAKCKLILVGINKANQALISFGRDLNDRIDVLKFETNPDESVAQLITLGEEKLNIVLTNKGEIVEESSGSFHIAQMLCFEHCVQAGVLRPCPDRRDINVSLAAVRQRIFDQQRRGFGGVANAFARGTKFRPEGRAPYLNLLHWLATGDEWSLNLVHELAKHPQLRGSISQVLDKGYLEDLIRSNSDINDLIFFDPLTKTLSVEDPKFVYYLRNLNWSGFAHELGYTNITFDSRYDFALSFAGSDRDIAHAIFEGLSEREIEVFYDRAEEHRMTAENLEDYFAPIYASEARYVIVIAGPDYPKRIWTRFESEQFKDRFGTHSIIPVWDTRHPPTFFDETFKVGGFSFDRTADLTPQIAHIVDVLARKLVTTRAENTEAAPKV
jgi:hypothetical protein